MKIQNVFNFYWRFVTYMTRDNNVNWKQRKYLHNFLVIFSDCIYLKGRILTLSDNAWKKDRVCWNVHYNDMVAFLDIFSVSSFLLTVYTRLYCWQSTESFLRVF